jgi:hypothetical protein
LCSRPSQCANCSGPHDSQSPDCPARPAIINGKLQYKTKAQREALQSAGRKAASETFSKLPQPLQPAAQAIPSSPLSSPEVEMLADDSEATPAADGSEVEPSVDGSDSFMDAEEGTTTPRGYKARSRTADPRSASPQGTRGRRRAREASPAPILDRRTRAGRHITPSFKFPYDI